MSNLDIKKKTKLIQMQSWYSSTIFTLDISQKNFVPNLNRPCTNGKSLNVQLICVVDVKKESMTHIILLLQ